MLGTILSNSAAGLLALTTTFGGVTLDNPLTGIAKQAIAAVQDNGQLTAEFPKSGDKVIKQKVTVTAYSSTPDQTDDTPFITANGSHVRDGIVAANFLKFGTRVRIPKYFGDKVFTVEDRMNVRFNDRMDIWMSDRDDAYAWGIRNVDIEILPPVREVAMNK